MTTPTAPRVLRDGCLDGVSALVTGAGSGIGRACAQRLVELGARVAGLGRHREALDETAAGCVDPGRLESVVCDVRDSAVLAEAVRAVGDRHGLQVLVNNAGGQFASPAHEISDRGWAAVVDLNLNAVFTATREAYPYLARSGGAVVSISLSGVERGGMGMAHSVAARGGVLALTRTLALEWARAGIRANCVGPGTVLTPGLRAEADPAVLERLVSDATPMRCATDVAEVAELVAFLASPAAAMLTGQLVHIDGGAHLGPGLHLLGATS